MPRTGNRHERHQTPTGSGTLAHIRIHGTLHRRHFPKGTPPVQIRQWVLTTELRHRKTTPGRTGRFEDDARAYLEAVRAMPSYSDRALHIEEWIAVFGSRYRDSITSDEIRAQLQRWLTDTREITYTRVPTPKTKASRTMTLSVSSVDKRRTALMHLYTVLDGKSAPNPVRDVPKFTEPEPAARAIPFPIVQALFKALRPSKSRARLKVIAFTGIPHAQIKTIQPEDIDPHAGTVAVAGRRKGRGTRARIVPLMPEGLAAFREMAKEEAWGPFSNSSLRKALRRGMETAAPELAAQVTPYDLRHSFGTEMYRRSGDIRATQILMDHSTERLTHRYTSAAEDGRVRAALTAWTAKGSKPSSKTKKKTTKRR